MLLEKIYVTFVVFFESHFKNCKHYYSAFCCHGKILETTSKRKRFTSAYCFRSFRCGSGLSPLLWVWDEEKDHVWTYGGTNLIIHGYWEAMKEMQRDWDHNIPQTAPFGHLTSFHHTPPPKFPLPPNSTTNWDPVLQHMKPWRILKLQIISVSSALSFLWFLSSQHTSALVATHAQTLCILHCSLTMQKET